MTAQAQTLTSNLQNLVTIATDHGMADDAAKLLPVVLRRAAERYNYPLDRLIWRAATERAIGAEIAAVCREVADQGF